MWNFESINKINNIFLEFIEKYISLYLIFIDK